MKNRHLFLLIFLSVSLIFYWFIISQKGIKVQIKSHNQKADVAIFPYAKNPELLDIRFIAKNFTKLGQTPIETHLDEGKYLITLRHDNSLPIMDTIRVTKKNRQFNFRLLEGFRYVYKGNYQYKDSISVWVKSFYLADKELSNEQYLYYVNENSVELPVFFNDSRFNQPDQPVIGMNYDEAVAYTQWFSKKYGVKARLPYEYEWEFAANNGDTSRTFPWGRHEKNTSQFLANYHPYDYSNQKLLPQDVDGFIYPAPVASYPPTDQRFYDLAGNVFEWLLDTLTSDKLLHIYNDYNLGETLLKQARIVKGGAWNFNQNLIKIRTHIYVDGSQRLGNNGIRILIEEANYLHLVN